VPRKRSAPRSFILPLLPRRRGVLFPNVAAPILVGRRTSVRAVDEATQRGLDVAIVTQRDPSLTDLDLADLFPIATEAVINRALRLPDGTTQVWAQGQRRLQIEEIVATEPFYQVRVRPIPEDEDRPVATEALMRAVLALFEKVVRLSPSLPEDAYVMAMNVDKPGWLADFVASSLELDDAEAQTVLSTLDAGERLQRVNIILARELDVLELQSQIHTKVQEEVDKSQREYFLREQLKAIQKELGEIDPQSREVANLREKIAASGMPAEVAARAEEELRRLEQMPIAAPETSVIRTYVDWLVTLPWTRRTQDTLDLHHAAAILDRNHYGLSRVKERILEFMAVRSLVQDGQRSPILCFVGPPGVGKTSLGRSIAEALARKFARVSLGGIRDEAEIRGHRRTYVGAMPGRIIQTMRSVGTVNPVFMLDEIDKVGTDFRGDPSSALLEALDPEQNTAFSDHYLDVPYDLSQALFITTANMLDPIIPALRDRLEVIELSGYVEDEKLNIAKRFLVPRQLVENGLEAGALTFTDAALRRIIREYTHEAGVRNLEREIGQICRKVARRVAEGRRAAVHVSPATVARYLGPEKYFWGMAEEHDEIGVATGVARTEMGGDVLSIEVTLMPGKGSLTLTGQLGEVMRESAQAALSFARSRSHELEIGVDEIEKQDIHVHVPAGGVPKDGPSAGITIATALISVLARRPVDRQVAMTGEITLRGRVLPVGGVKEKVLAAHRAGIKTFVMPAKNRKDLAEVPEAVRRSLHFVFVEEMREVLPAAFHDWQPGRAREVSAARRTVRSASAAVLPEVSKSRAGRGLTRVPPLVSPEPAHGPPPG
jgi:ATP-dependent Lon protease